VLIANEAEKAYPGIPAMTKHHSGGHLLCVSSNNDLMDMTDIQRKKELSLVLAFLM
jgi:hypothetical protein